MPDPESRFLDLEILAFIRKYRTRPAPGLAFEWLALKLFDHQFRRNAHYRRFCELEKKVPGSVRSWREIPAMPALAFKELVLVSFPVGRKVRVFQTSGTTGGGAPRGAHLFDTFRLYETAVLPPFGKYLLNDGARLSYYFLVPPSGDAPHSSLSYMADVLDRCLAHGHGKYYVKKGVPLFAELSKDLRKEQRPALVFSTAFVLKGFLDFLAREGTRLRLKKGSRLLETGGFKGRHREISKRSLYVQCQKSLGIPAARCVSEYGMTELSSQMYAATGGVFTGPAWLKTLVIDPRTGREARAGRAGILRHIDLANRGSVLAVQTEDLGRSVAGGFELLGRAKGAELRGCSLTYEEFIRSGG